MSSAELDLLRKMPIFGGLSDRSLGSILCEATNICVPGGEYFFREGDPGGFLFVLRQGTVQVERVWNGRCIVLRKLGPSDCFGEMALVDFQPRSASVRATADCIAIRLSLDTLRALYQSDVEQYAIIMMNMGREVSRRLRAADERLLELQAPMGSVR